MEILKSLFSILILALLGVLSRKVNIFDRDHIKVISSFVYYFALPSLFFSSLAKTDIFSIDYEIIIGSVLPVFLLLLILFLLKVLHLLSKDNFILLSLSICFGSNAFFGVALFETLYGGKWLPLALVTASLLGVTGIVLSLLLFEYANKKGKGLVFIKKIIKNPLIISIALGVFCSAIGIKLDVLINSLSLLGQTAGGLAIFALGIFVYDNFSIQSVKKVLFYSIFRSVALPISTFIVIFMTMNANSETSMFLFLQSGIPAAISLAVFAERYEYKLSEITGMIILTSLFSFFVIVVIFFISEFIF